MNVPVPFPCIYLATVSSPFNSECPFLYIPFQMTPSDLGAWEGVRMEVWEGEGVHAKTKNALNFLEK